MCVGFSPSCKIKASGQLARLVRACVSKGITCWGCFTNDLDTEIAGRSPKDFTSGRSLNQTLRVGCWTNPSPAAPAAPASAGAVSGLAYPRIEQLGQHITKITNVEENPCRLWGFRVCTAAMRVPFHHSCLSLVLGFFSQKRFKIFLRNVCAERDTCLVCFIGETHDKRQCHRKIDWMLE